MLRAGLLVLTAFWVVEALEPMQVGPIVYVEQGALRGSYLTSASGRIFAAFQGVPYARPPVGKHRFKEPVPHKPWRGVWPATNPGSECLQWKKGLHGEEDCLFLNVYSPMLPAGGAPLLNVIVNFHGGAFMYGSSELYGPKFLLDRDVILVTVNYRLGPLGFLSTEDEVVPGNMGLKDQVVALRWVQRNIAAFGGNPASVTIAGQSAGGVSVHYHYLSPMSHGLFQRGIAMSGSAFCNWAFMENGRAKAAALAQSLGCYTQTSRELVDCLRHRPAGLIVQQVPNFHGWKDEPYSPFGPTAEGAGITPFMTVHPVEAFLNGTIQDLPLLMSVTTDEGLFPAAAWITNEEILNEIETQFADVLPHILDYNNTVPEQQKQIVADSIKQHYLQNNPLTLDTAANLVKMIGDRQFVVEVERAARFQAAAATSPVYFYQFGTCHGDDAGYVLETEYSNVQSQPDKDMSRFLLDVWDSFAKTGKPIPAGSNLMWDPVPADNTELAYLYIANTNHLEMRSTPDLGQRAFWDSLPINEPQIKAQYQAKQPVQHQEL
ncbi:Venom carboxylesterase-6 [Blattella germanica]|nr:Venom carboxylesterase-6 [Blattella germanica]